jgi:xanthine/uracil/vitamin C permease (AzgA family)
MPTSNLLVLFLLVTVAAIAWLAPVALKDAAAVKFELAKSTSDAESVLGDFHGDRWRRMQATFQRDAPFILGYTGFFVVAGLGVGRFSTGLSWSIVLLALAAAVFDILENAYGLKVLSASLSEGSVPLLRRMASWSQLKWFSLGPLALAIAWADFAHHGSVWGRVSAGLFLAAGLIFTASWPIPSLLYGQWPLALLGAGMIAHTVVAFQQRI